LTSKLPHSFAFKRIAHCLSLAKYVESNVNTEGQNAVLPTPSAVAVFPVKTAPTGHCFSLLHTANASGQIKYNDRRQVYNLDRSCAAVWREPSNNATGSSALSSSISAAMHAQNREHGGLNYLRTHNVLTKAPDMRSAHQQD